MLDKHVQSYSGHNCWRRASETGGSQFRDIALGLALGILMDTFLVRALLVPSTVVLAQQVEQIAPQDPALDQPGPLAAGNDPVAVQPQAGPTALSLGSVAEYPGISPHQHRAARLQR